MKRLILAPPLPFPISQDAFGPLLDLLGGEVADYQQHSLLRGIMAAVKETGIPCRQPAEGLNGAVGGVRIGRTGEQLLADHLVGDDLCLIPLLDQAGDPPLPGLLHLFLGKGRPQQHITQ